MIDTPKPPDPQEPAPPDDPNVIEIRTKTGAIVRLVRAEPGAAAFVFVPAPPKPKPEEDGEDK